MSARTTQEALAHSMKLAYGDSLIGERHDPHKDFALSSWAIHFSWLFSAGLCCSQVAWIRVEDEPKATKKKGQTMEETCPRARRILRDEGKWREIMGPFFCRTVWANF